MFDWLKIAQHISPPLNMSRNILLIVFRHAQYIRNISTQVRSASYISPCTGERLESRNRGRARIPMVGWHLAMNHDNVIGGKFWWLLEASTGLSQGIGARLREMHKNSARGARRNCDARFRQSTIFRSSLYRAQGNPWVKGSVFFVLIFAHPSFSPPLPPCGANLKRKQALNLWPKD